VALTSLLADFFEVCACWEEWERTHEVALRAARLAGDRHAEASLLRGLGEASRNGRGTPEFRQQSPMACRSGKGRGWPARPPCGG